MTANHTSHAVEEVLRYIESHKLIACRGRTITSLKAIAAKYAKMEEALRRCQELAEDATSPNEALVMVGQIRVVSDLALAFDPLTP